MKILGIAAEYDPFHKGHRYHLERSMEMTGADVSVAVMSGNFTQRGEPAVFDKWERAKAAAENGVDLVLELPFIYACNSAEFFAEGAVRILEGIGASYMSFGSEAGDTALLGRAAEFFADETDEYRAILKEGLASGKPFAKARQEAAEKLLDADLRGLLSGSNNILAVEYMKQIILQKSSIKPVTVKRVGADHTDDKSGGAFPSATALRAEMKKRNDKPAVFEDALFVPVMQVILSSSAEELGRIFSVSEGLENKMKNRFRYAKDYGSLVKELSSRRYAASRIKRMLVHTAAGLTKSGFEDARKGIYARVLAFSEKGASALRQIKEKDESIPVLTNINREASGREDIRQMLNFDILASDLYSLISGRDIYENCDMLRKPYSMKDFT